MPPLPQVGQSTLNQNVSRSESRSLIESVILTSAEPPQRQHICACRECSAAAVITWFVRFKAGRNERKSSSGTIPLLFTSSKPCHCEHSGQRIRKARRPFHAGSKVPRKR